MKIIFLDVDGVLNSYKNVVVDGGFPFPNGSVRARDPRHAEENLDRLAIGMVRKLAQEFDAKIVLHSTWRMHVDPKEFGQRWNLPIIGGTNPNVGKPGSIKEWLLLHPEVKIYVVLDDDDMHVGRAQITTSIYEGLTYANYIQAQKKLSYADEVADKPLPQ